MGFLVAMTNTINEKSFLVFQAYGAETVMNECVFALLSFCRHHQPKDWEKWEVWIYTDNPQFFKQFSDCPLPVFYREINQETIRLWHGEIDFVHRVKIEVLRDFTSNHSGNILYLDTDVCFTQPINDIFNNIGKGDLYMHILEGKIHESKNLVLQKLSKFLKTNRSFTVNGNTISIPEETAMWNAGVLGFHSFQTPLLEDALHFTDEVFPLFPKHLVEQFAFSFFFQKNNNLKALNIHIIHYWNLKEIRPVLAAFFKYFKNEKWETLVRLSTLVQFPDFMQQKANFYETRSVGGKLLKKKWTPEIPNWKEIKKYY